MNIHKQRLKSSVQRFWEKVVFGFGEDACWFWKAMRLPAGYGRFWDGTKKVSSHRYSWKVCRGDVPDGMFVLHHCDNPSCVNPNHLFLGTYSDNMYDMWEKNRHPTKNMGCKGNIKGEVNGKSKLTEDDVFQIRGLYSTGMVQREIASLFNVDPPAIWKIVHRKTWKHI